jgi:hypothetical protein
MYIFMISVSNLLFKETSITSETITVSATTITAAATCTTTITDHLGSTIWPLI